MSIVSGDRQTGVVGTTLPQPLIVRLADSAGVPEPRVVIRLVRDAATIDSATTDRSGLAVVRWTLDESASEQKAVAQANLASADHERIAVVFTATAIPDVPASMEVRGGGAVAAPGSAVDTIAAFVTDRFGNPVRAPQVNWLVKSGGGTVRPLDGHADFRGPARAIWVLGQTEGQNILEVSVASFTREITATATLTLAGTLVVTGESHSCALVASGAAYCWGDNSSGQLGTGRIDGESHPVPVPVVGGLRFSSIVAGGTHTCGLTSSNLAYCWGNSRSGQAGVGLVQLIAAPMPVATELRFTALAAGAHHTCGLTTERRAYCWGDNALGQLGDGADRTLDAPVGATGSGSPIAVALNEPFVEIASGSFTTCAISTFGATYCWGSNRFFEFGETLPGRCYFIGTLFMYSPGPVPCSTEPVSIKAIPALTSLAVSASAWCGRSVDGQLVCWGNATAVPQVLTTARILDVWVAGNIVCGPTEAGAVTCWRGWLPDFLTVPAFGGDGPIGRLASIGTHTCGITHDTRGLVVCWGPNASGQLGNGNTEFTPGVSQVLAPRGS